MGGGGGDVNTVRTIPKPYGKIIERRKIDNTEIHNCSLSWLGKELCGHGTDKWLTATKLVYLNFWLIPEMAILSYLLSFTSCFKINIYIKCFNISDIICILPVMCYLLLNVLNQVSFYWEESFVWEVWPSRAVG